MVVCGALLLVATLTAVSVTVQPVAARAVNISSVWLLPEEGFPVFYRYFRDRITWFEADAVCQFHHANLVTVDSSEQFDAARAYLKELDVTQNVWTGLKRNGLEGEFIWTDYKPLENGGYWQEQIPATPSPVCAALDPKADYRWHPFTCGGPQVASFICQLQVPSWASKADGCMLSSLPSLTVTYLPEQGAVELISDCGQEGTRRIACKGSANRDEMMKQLSCESSTESQTEATSSNSNTWESDGPTRHRRDTEVTVDMASARRLATVPTTEGLTEVNAVEVTKDSPLAQDMNEVPAEVSEATQNLTSSSPTTTVAQPLEMSAAEEPVRTSLGLDLFPDESPAVSSSVDISAQNRTSQKESLDSELPKDLPRKDALDESLMEIPMNSIARLASEDAPISQEEADKRQVIPHSKPIPPSLRGNSPFVEPTLPPNRTEPAEQMTTPKPVEKESHEVFRESKAEVSLPGVKSGPHFPTLTVYNANNDRDPDESSSRVDHLAHAEAELSTAVPGAASVPVRKSQDTPRFFTRVLADQTTTTTTTRPAGAKLSSGPDTENDFFIATEIPAVGSVTSLSKQTPAGALLSSDAAPMMDSEPAKLSEVGDMSSDQEMADEAANEAPERPNRGRLLVRPQHRSFYPYFLNRVLG